MTGPSAADDGHPSPPPDASLVFELTYWVAAQYKVTLLPADAEAELRAAGHAEGADIAARVSRGGRGCTDNGEADDDASALAAALAQIAARFGADSPAGEPTDWDTPEGYHVLARPLPDPAGPQTPALPGGVPAVLAALLASATTDAQASVVRDLALAAGLQWHCGPCDWYNPGADPRCENCGSARPASASDGRNAPSQITGRADSGAGEFPGRQPAPAGLAVTVEAPGGFRRGFAIAGDDTLTVLVDGQPAFGVDANGPGHWPGGQWRRLLQPAAARADDCGGYRARTARASAGPRPCGDPGDRPDESARRGAALPAPEEDAALVIAAGDLWLSTGGDDPHDVLTAPQREALDCAAAVARAAHGSLGLPAGDLADGGEDGRAR